MANEPEMVILVGDLTYADDHLLVRVRRFLLPFFCACLDASHAADINPQRVQNDTSTIDFDGDWDGARCIAFAALCTSSLAQQPV